MKRFLFAFSVLSVLWIAACNGSGSTITPPPPVGKYSVASLKGQYAFVTSGEVIANGAASPSSISRTGSFTADGTGIIQTGIEDVVEPGVLPNLAIPISGGSYTVDADGRGTLTLNVTAAGVPSTINFGIVLTSTTGGLMMDETSVTAQASTGSGNFILQNSTTFTNPVLPVTATYVFDFTGVDGTGAPDSLVGEFTAGSGVINTGFEDANDNFSLTNGIIPPGSLTQDPANVSTLTSFGRGTAQVAGEAYVFYIVDATRLRFISTGGGAMLSGDAVIQDNTIPANVSAINSSFVFLVAGTGASGGITRVGRFTANGAAVTNVLEDSNDGGKPIPTNKVTNASISLDLANPGRGTLTFTDSNFPNAPGTYVFYLSSSTQGVIQDQTSNNKTGPVDVADGTIAAQVGGPFSSSNITGTYALNWSGLSTQNGNMDEEDFLGQATVSSLALTGAADIFEFESTAPVPNLTVGGSITIGGNGTEGDGNRNTMAVKLNGSGSLTVNCVVYVVSPQLAFFANNQDTTRLVAGIIQAQQ